jgi:polar amino acid transport system substrate-binding protein
MDMGNEWKPEAPRARTIRLGLSAVDALQDGLRIVSATLRHLSPGRGALPARRPVPPCIPLADFSVNLPSREVKNCLHTRGPSRFPAIARYSSRNLIRIASLYLFLVVCLAIGMLVPPAQAQSPGTTVPGFWDPKRRVERPPAASVQAIRFVTTDDFPPFNFLNADGRLTGFNVDLARAICDELDIGCTIQAREWDDTLNAVRQGGADAVIAGLAITTAAREELDFSDVYMRWPGRFIVRRDADAIEISPDGLKGKTLAVVARTAHEAYLAAFFPEVGRKLYPTPEAAREAVKSGEADAHFGDGMQLSFWLQSEAAEACCVFTGGPYLESRFFGEGLAIAVPRGREDLKQAIDAALAALQEKGVYAELYLRYFPVGFF